MITSKAILKAYIQEDSHNYSFLFPYRVGLFRSLRSYVCSPINDQVSVWAYIKNLRYTEYWMNQTGLLAKIVSLYYMLKLRKLSKITGFQIPIRTIGKGLTIWHWGTIIINEDAQIGDYCTLRPGIIIGHKKEGEKSPVIGNYVEINSGARIIGDINIGDDVIIAPNAVVTHDVPSHSIVAGVPAKIIKQRKSRDSKWEKYNG